MRLFLTGIPGIGKTTVIRGVLKRLRDLRCAGFYTEEKRHQSQRIGFQVITLDGQEGTLASMGKQAPRVGRYFIHVAAFEQLVLAQLDFQITPADLYVIDEIGKMELLSQKFKTKVIELLNQPSNVLATIAKKGNGFAEQIKRRDDIELIEVTRENRDRLSETIVERIGMEFGIS